MSGVVQLWFPVVVVSTTRQEHERIIEATCVGRSFFGKTEVPSSRVRKAALQ